MAPEEYTVGFYDEAAYAEFAEVDCDDFRELIEIIRKDPFPDKSGLKWEIPGTVNEFFAFKQTDDLIFKLTYLWNSTQGV